MIVDDVVQIPVKLRQVPQDRLRVTKKGAIIISTNSIYRFGMSAAVRSHYRGINLLPRSRAISRAS
jgi:hypothetical protein